MRADAIDDAIEQACVVGWLENAPPPEVVAVARWWQRQVGFIEEVN